MDDFALPRPGRRISNTPGRRGELESAVMTCGFPPRTVERCTGLRPGQLAEFIKGKVAPTADEARAVAKFLRHPNAEYLFETDAPRYLRTEDGRVVVNAQGKPQRLSV